MKKSKSQKKIARFVWPKIGPEEEAAVLSQLRETVSIYGKGGIFEKFENAFSVYHGRKYSLLCSSGTTAIHSMFVAAGIKSGDEVICPAYTFFATVTPLFFLGAIPVLCDCDDNGNIDPEEIVKKITDKTKAIIVTHMWGIPAQIDKIKQICRRHKILLLEDCSHAHGATFHGQVVGSFGDIAAWSLQGSKLITGGEGGILSMDKKIFYDKALLLGHYNKRCHQEISRRSPLEKYAHTGMGLKYRAHPLAIALAYTLFLKFPKASRYRHKYARLAIKRFAGVPAFKMPPAYFDKNISPSWYAFIFLLDIEGKNSILQKKRQFLTSCYGAGLADIDSPNSTTPLNLLPLFQNPTPLFPSYVQNGVKYKAGDFPRAEKFYRSVLKMPLGVDRTDAELFQSYLNKLTSLINNL